MKKQRQIIQIPVDYDTALLLYHGAIFQRDHVERQLDNAPSSRKDIIQHFEKQLELANNLVDFLDKVINRLGGHK